jgi:Na+-translocating ferredoxin:NAD+ oxidoreductase subunit G
MVLRRAALAIGPIACPLIAAFPSAQEAAVLAFPQAQITRRDRILTEAQAARVKTLAQRPLPGPGVAAFEAHAGGRLVGVAFLDTHRVRTQMETVLVAVEPPGRVRRVEILAFGEPPEYQAGGAWTRQFDGKALDDGLALRRGIRPLGGASLTATALVDASRRGLALFQVLYGEAR